MVGFCCFVQSFGGFFCAFWIEIIGVIGSGMKSSMEVCRMFQ